MSASATQAQERTTTTTSERHLTGPASPAQVRALHRFGADTPPALGKQEASDWMDAILEKVRIGARLTSDDLSGPPRLRPALDFVQNPVKTAPVATLPSVPVPEAAFPLPEAPEPAGSETDDQYSHPEPDGEDYLPTSDAWCSVDSEIVMNAYGELVSSRTSVRLSGHASPGESWGQVASRLGSIAQNEVAKAAARPV